MLKWNYPNKDRRLHILKLATPIIFGMLSFNVLDIVDTAMIGQLGNNALAATGFASFLFFVSFSATMGIAGAIQTMSARRLGEKKYDECGLPLNAGLIIVVGYSLICWAIMSLTAPYILSLFSSDGQVVQLAQDYYMWRLPGVLAIGVSFCFRGFWNGIKQPNTYTIILVATHSLNILLNWLFIFGNFGCPDLGVKGAAIGSSLSLYVGMIAYIFVTKIKKSSMNVCRVFPKWSEVKALFRLGTPAAVDQFLFSLFLLGLFWIFGQIGTQATAVAHVVLICVMLLFVQGIGLGLTSLSLVSIALGQGNAKDAKQWAWDIIKLGIPVISIVGLILFFFPQSILSIFIQNKDTIDMAIFPFRLDLIMMGSVCIGVVFLESLLGAGATRFIMIFKLIFRYGLLLPGAYALVVFFDYGLNAVWLFWAMINFIETLILIGIWQRERWTRIKV